MKVCKILYNTADWTHFVIKQSTKTPFSLLDFIDITDFYLETSLIITGLRINALVPGCGTAVRRKNEKTFKISSDQKVNLDRLRVQQMSV